MLTIHVLNKEYKLKRKGEGWLKGKIKEQHTDAGVVAKMKSTQHRSLTYRPVQ